MQFSRLTYDAAGLALSAAAFVRDIARPPLRLGVTGLAGSGKTVFITSLIHNLIAGGRLPFFSAASEGRIRRAYLDPQPDDAVPRFAYDDNLERLTSDPPRWPESTTRVSQLRFTIEYDSARWLKGALSQPALTIDIVDYPGEWILDLPLLNYTYEVWSKECLELTQSPARRSHAAGWLKMIGAFDAGQNHDEQKARKAAAAYKDYLAKCRETDPSPSILTPGRFLLPGELVGSPALTYSPLVLPEHGHAPRGSLWAMMARRFEAYKTHIVKPFFRDHFARLHRQIVLVDPLAALSEAPEALKDLERVLTDIFYCFRPGRNPWLPLPWQTRIDKILFAATKADHVHHASHDRLTAILSRIMAEAKTHADFRGAEVGTLSLAAVRATREAEAHEDSDILPCIVGVPLPGERVGGKLFDGKEEYAVFPGDLPDDVEAALQAGRKAAIKPPRQNVRFPRFSPPLPVAIRPGPGAALPHIRLDHALEFLLGDRLR